MTFEMKLGAGFMATILAAFTICGIALYGLNVAVKSSHAVMLDYSQVLILAGRLGVEEESRVAASRGFLISGDKLYLDKMELARKSFLRDLDLLQKSNISVSHNKLLSELKEAEEAYQKSLSEFIQARLNGASLKSLTNSFEGRLQPQRDNLKRTVDDYITYIRTQLDSERKELSDSNRSIFYLVLAVSLIALALAAAMALTITKTVSKLYRETQDVAKLREEIVEMVAHDLRTPITAVNLSVQVLLRMTNSKGVINSDNLHRITQNIKRATDRANGLIGGLLDLAKMKAGTLSIERVSVFPKNILADVSELFDNIAKEKGVKLEVEQVPLPAIQCDSERIMQVFSNLIGNALKFSTPRQKIIFGALIHDASVVFFVTDQGPGIPEEEQSHIFERYWKKGSHNRTSAGLGLAICKALVTAHEGKIWVESTVGSGSTFYFTIPANKGSLALSVLQGRNYQEV